MYFLQIFLYLLQVLIIPRVASEQTYFCISNWG
jgi:hypothetical protein